MSYGPTSLENHAGAARYIDRILKGAKNSQLPFEEPTEFKLATQGSRDKKYVFIGRMLAEDAPDR